jgi:hypothetical protein
MGGGRACQAITGALSAIREKSIKDTERRAAGPTRRTALSL